MDEAASAGPCFVTGSGFGVLATKSVVLKLCENEPPAERVRVDMIPFVDSPGPVSSTLAATIIDGIPNGCSRYEAGRLVPSGFGADAELLVLSDGSTVTSAGVPFGELEAARRASGTRVHLRRARSSGTRSPSKLAARSSRP